MNHINDIYSRRDPLIKQFIEENGKAIQEFDKLINRNIYHAMKLALDTPGIGEAWHELECLKLIDHAIKISITCTDLFKQLKFLESVILSRHVIELCANCIAISKSEQHLAEFLTDKNFGSTKSIGVAKKYIPEIGELYGQISNYLVHVNPYSHGTNKEAKDGGISIKFSFSVFDIYLPEDKHREMYIMYNELVLYLIQATIEIAFFERIEYEGLAAFKHPNNKDIILGQEGLTSFSKRFDTLFKEDR